MQTLTENITLSANQFMWLNMKLYLRRRWYLLAIIFAGAIASMLLQEAGSVLKYILLVVAIWYPMVVFLGFRKQSKSAAVAGQLQSRLYLLDGQTLRTTYANGDQFATERADITHLEIIGDTYLLFTSPGAYIFVTQFLGVAEHDAFKQWLYFTE